MLNFIIRFIVALLIIAVIAFLLPTVIVFFLQVLVTASVLLVFLYVLGLFSKESNE